MPGVWWCPIVNMRLSNDINQQERQLTSDHCTTDDTNLPLWQTRLQSDSAPRFASVSLPTGRRWGACPAVARLVCAKRVLIAHDRAVERFAEKVRRRHGDLVHRIWDRLWEAMSDIGRTVGQSFPPLAITGLHM